MIRLRITALKIDRSKIASVDTIVLGKARGVDVHIQGKPTITLAMPPQVNAQLTLSCRDELAATLSRES